MKCNRWEIIPFAPFIILNEGVRYRRYFNLERELFFEVNIYSVSNICPLGWVQQSKKF